MQFKCKNGRIILRLGFHEWNKSDVLSQEISSTSEIVVLMTEVINEFADTLSLNSALLTPSSSQSEEPSPTKRKTSSQPEEPPPPKRRSEMKHMKDVADEAIERQRIGMTKKNPHIKHYFSAYLIV